MLDGIIYTQCSGQGLAQPFLTWSKFLTGQKILDGNLTFTLNVSKPTPEKAVAPHSSTLAWQIPWMEGPGGLQSMRSLGVRHD